MSVRKDLGMVTAYAYAVSKGYTGTEEEFAELMADYADVGERAEAAAEAAAASATAASGSASDSAASATAAEGFAGNASTSAGTASQAAQNASQSATAASGSATAAAGSATAAAGSATTAGNKATEAAQSATGAAASATTAESAKTAAQAAQTAAETAQTAAEDAQAAAEAAAQTLVIDPTLTQPNQAAEAKATGDAISLVKSQLESTNSALAQGICIYDPAWIQGRVMTDGTFDDTQTSYRRTDFIDVSILNGMPIVNTNPTYSSYLYEYSSNDVSSFLGYAQIMHNATTTFVPRTKTKYVVLSLAPRFVNTDYLTFYTRSPEYTLALSNSKRIDSVENKTDVIVISPNLLDEKGVFTKDSYIKHDGSIGTNAGWYLAEQYINVTPGTKYTVKFWNGTSWSEESSAWYSFYTADKTPLGGLIISTSVPAVAPNNAKYLRVSFGLPIYNGHPMVGTVEDMASVSEFVPFGNSIKNYTAIDELTKIVNDVNILLPEKCYAVVGSEFNIYTRNVVTINNYDDFDYYWTVSPYTMTYNLYSDCLRFTPTASDIGAYTITLYVKRHSDWKTVVSKSMVLEVVANSTLTEKRVVFIGDSLTNAGYYPYEIQNVLSSGGVVSVGTQTSRVWIDNVQRTINHEGRGGWSITDYVTKSDFGGATNAFWNPSTSKFDFGYWMSTNGFAIPDAVFLNLGTNGAHNVDANISGLDEMIASIRQSSATVPILISLITPPATQDGWTYAVHGGSANQFAVQQMTLNARYIAEYDGRTAENIFLSPVYFNLDRYHDYNTAEFPVSARNPEVVTLQTNNVHPSVCGYYKFADVYWAMIQRLLA